MPVPQHQMKRGAAPLNEGERDFAPGIRRLCDDLELPTRTEQIAQLTGYLGLLQRWNAVYNLTAIRDPAAMLTQHLGDCLALVGPLQRFRAGRDAAAARLLDVGSGAGLPGIVVAIMVPELPVVCVDTVAKKASFIRQAAGELGLSARLQARHARVESLAREGFSLITARAFSSLEDLVSLTRPLLTPGGAWVAMKGRVPHDEIAALPAGAEVFHVEQLTVPGLDAERCLVWMRHQERRAP